MVATGSLATALLVCFAVVFVSSTRDLGFVVSDDSIRCCTRHFFSREKEIEVGIMCLFGNLGMAKLSKPILLIH